MKALALLLAAPLIACAADKHVDAGPYVPSPQSVVADMLKLADIGPKDFVIDLGSGDGRIVLTAAKVFGASGFGVEIKDELVKLSNEAAKKEGVADRVKFIKQDLFKTDISKATVLTMYLLPHTVNMLKDKLLTELKPGAKVLSHDYPLAGWIPEKYVQMDLEDKVQISGVTTTLIYLYMVPAKVAGRWSAKVPPAVGKGPLTLNLRQQVTRVSGSAQLEGKEVVLEDLKLRGTELSFSLARRKATFTGQVKDGVITGDVDTGSVKTPWSATLGTRTQISTAKPITVNPTPSKPAGKSKLLAGSGFVVSQSGHVLTNAHVVESCDQIEIRMASGKSVTGKVVAMDQRNDLAVLLVDAKPSAVATFRGGNPIEMGESVLAFGFPLAGLLASSGNVTTGNITALAGIGDDSRLLQISVPIQAGNSGGPLLDMSGNVVGVIVSTLDAIRVANVTGDIPQNVNFAIRGTLAENFLHANNVKTESSPSIKTMKASDATKRARAVATQVFCQKQ